MSSGAFVTTAAQMTAAASKVDDTNNEVRTMLSSLRSSVEGVSAYWSGQAHTAFVGIMSRYDADAQKLSQALTAIAEQIRESGTGYTQSDEGGTQTLTSAGGSLNLG